MAAHRAPIPGILQARTLEWVTISFSIAWKWKVNMKLHSRVWLFVTPWTAAYQAPLTMDFPGKSTGVGCQWLISSSYKDRILGCEVKRALGSITMNKASGGDGIPVELFQILKDDAVKELHSVCQQLWKTQQWPQDWKRSVFILIPKKGNVKECSNWCTIVLISR